MTKREEGKGSKGPFYVQRLSEEKSHFPRRHSEKTKHPKKPKTARDLYIRVQDGQVATSELNSFHLNTVFVPPSGASTGMQLTLPSAPSRLVPTMYAAEAL